MDLIEKSWVVAVSLEEALKIKRELDKNNIPYWILFSGNKGFYFTIDDIGLNALNAKKPHATQDAILQRDCLKKGAGNYQFVTPMDHAHRRYVLKGMIEKHEEDLRKDWGIK